MLRRHWTLRRIFAWLCLCRSRLVSVLTVSVQGFDHLLAAPRVCSLAEEKETVFVCFLFFYFIGAFH